MIFGQFASAAMLFFKFNAGTRKSLSDFCLPLLEQAMKFILNTIIRFIALLTNNTVFGPGFSYSDWQN